MSTEFVTAVVSIIVTLIGGNGIIMFLVSHHFNKKEKDTKEDKLVKETLSFLSYTTLKQEGLFLINKGYAKEAERTLIHRMHDTYKKWGWNGDMDSLMEKVDNLPFSPEEK